VWTASYRPVEGWSYTEAGKVVSVTIGTTDADSYPCGWKYSLHYGTINGETILRYDNAHEDTKGHEKHTAESVETIDFPGMVPLYDRFIDRIRPDFDDLPR
jgi:hypothetical protein